jgi:hypothetical protein
VEEDAPGRRLGIQPWISLELLDTDVLDPVVLLPGIEGTVPEREKENPLFDISLEKNVGRTN